MANYLDMESSILQERLAEYGIKVMILSNRYKHKLVKLEKPNMDESALNLLCL